MIEDYRQDGSKIGLIMIDLDNFKLYNETMGSFFREYPAADCLRYD